MKVEEKVTPRTVEFKDIAQGEVFKFVRYGNEITAIKTENIVGDYNAVTVCRGDFYHINPEEQCRLPQRAVLHVEW